MSAMAYQITGVSIFLLNRLFGRRLKKTPKLRLTGLCASNSPVAGEFPAQRASNAENVSIRWRHHVQNNKKNRAMRTTAVVYCILEAIINVPVSYTTRWTFRNKWIVQRHLCFQKDKISTMWSKSEIIQKIHYETMARRLVWVIPFHFGVTETEREWNWLLCSQWLHLMWSPRPPQVQPVTTE